MKKKRLLWGMSLLCLAPHIQIIQAQDANEAKTTIAQETPPITSTMPSNSEIVSSGPSYTASEVVSGPPSSLSPNMPVSVPIATNTSPNTSPTSSTTPQPESVEGENAEEFDTVNLTEEQIGFRGNWVKKREWLLRAKELNRKIQDTISECKNMQNVLFKDFNNIQMMLDALYQDTARRVGKLHEGLVEIFGPISEDAQKKSNEPSLEPMKEFDDKTIIINKVKSIDDEMVPVKNLDDALTKRIEKLNEQISILDEEGKKSSDLYESIWDIIDDTKAQANFYSLKDVSRQVKSIRDYIQTDFGQDFQSTIETTKRQIDSFREKLIDYESTIKNLQKEAKEREEARLKKLRKKPEAEAWYSAFPKKIIGFFSSIINSIVSFVKGLFGKK